MRNWTTAVADLLRRLLKSTPAVPADTGAADKIPALRYMTGDVALLAIEATLGASIGHAAGKLVPYSLAESIGLCADEMRADSPRELLTRAKGQALAGQRVAVFVHADDLTHGLDIVAGMAAHRVPMVIHAASRTACRTTPAGTAGWWAVRETGALFAHARDPQHAADLALVARRLAETALRPVIVLADGADTALATAAVSLPTTETLTAWIGNAADEIDAPALDQRLWFGDRRRRVPQWFDLDRPATLAPYRTPSIGGVMPTGADPTDAGELTAMMSTAFTDIGRRLGRSVGPILDWRSNDATHVIVAVGRGIAPAIAAADFCRRVHGWPVGVVGLTWLCPLPSDALRSAIPLAETLTVLEPPSVVDGEWPLTQAIRAAVSRPIQRITTALVGPADAPIAPSAVVAAVRHATMPVSAAAPVSVVALTGDASSLLSRFPKREALTDRLRRERAPSRALAIDAADRAADSRPSNARTVAVYTADAADPLTVSLADKLGSVGHPALVTRVEEIEAMAWRTTMMTAPTPAPASAPALPLVVGGPIELVVFATSNVPPPPHLPFIDLAPTAVALVPASVTALPTAWRRAIAAKNVSVFAFPDGADLVDAVGTWLDTGSWPPTFAPLAMAPDTAAAESTAPPAILASHRVSQSTFDDLARFHGETLQPLAAGEVPLPDPYTVRAAVPAGSAAFHPPPAIRAVLPTIDGSRCVGCGACWVSCSDAAIAPVAIGTKVLLDAAADIAESTGAIADKLRRQHRHLGAWLDGQLAKGSATTVTVEEWRAGFEWLIEQLKPQDDERTVMQQAAEKTLAVATRLPAAATAALFHEPHQAAKGSGNLLVLAVNPDTCQGCGGCAAVCAESAIRLDPATPELAATHRLGWRTWEALPDTPGETIEYAKSHATVGALAAVQLSRSCLLPLIGRDGAEPGAGDRVALRQTLAVVEYHRQRHTLALAAAMRERENEIRRSIRQLMADVIPTGDVEMLTRALSDLQSRHAPLPAIAARIEAAGRVPVVDARRIKKLAEVAGELDAAHRRLVEGPTGLGRSRVALVMGDGATARWAAGFPWNPLLVPLIVEDAGEPGALAEGIAAGVWAHALDGIRALRRAALLLEWPGDWEPRERALAQLDAEALTADERAALPPVLLIAGASAKTALGGRLGAVADVLAGRWPIKILLLDDKALLNAPPNPVLPAIAHRRAFVASTSMAHADHFFASVTQALEFAGPALLHVHAPSPSRHGFSADQTIARARLAVTSRVHPLLIFDPRRRGVFGSRLSLEMNPDLAAPVATDAAANTRLTPTEWAAGESRFAEHWPPAESAERTQAPSPALAEALAEVAENWLALQELAGVDTPFTADVRRQIQDELAAVHAAELAALRRDHAAALESAYQTHLHELTARLRDRLLVLAKPRPN